jgi:uncharacterized membrane protein YkvA (DUF1232 family)
MARDSSTRARSETTADRSRSRRRRSGAISRVVAMLGFVPVAGRAPLYARLVWSLLVDERTPMGRKALLAGALGYVLLGRDLVPDDVPVIGGIDDLVVVALAVDLFLGGVDDAILDEKLADLGIPRAAYDEDVARIRRLMPGLLRRVARRIPGAIGVVGDAMENAGVAPRMRAWLGQEGSNA